MNNPIKQSAALAGSNDQAMDQAQATCEAALAEGLCATCDNQETCVLPKTSAAVLNCDELDYPGGTSCANLPGDKPTLTLAPEPKQAPESELETKVFLGLCATCEIRSKCKFPKQESGVWCCEEFV